MGWLRRPKPSSGFELSEEEVYSQLEKSEECNSLFLWRYSRIEMVGRLERASVLSRIRELGYPFPAVTVRVEEGVHLLRIEVPGGRAPLMDLRLSEEVRLVTDSVRSSLGSESLSLLVIQWVALQHVAETFSTDRPALPGQRYPALGLGRKLYPVLCRIARELGKDALSAYPLYYHNAVYYSEGFSYLSPRKQGELLALRRDLVHLRLNEASQGIHAGNLLNGSTGEKVEWNPGEMFAPVSRRVRAYLAGAEYRAAVRRMAADVSFRLKPS